MAQPFSLARWVADPDRNTFARDGRTVRVEPKVMELCVRLAEARGMVVSKAELLDSVWPGTAVGEDALTRAVSELRRALDDDARHPRILETIPKRGYRLIPPVEASPSEPGHAPSPARPDAAISRRTAIFAGAVGAGMVLIGILALRPNVAPPSAAAPLRVLVTTLENRSSHSPSGTVLRRTVEEALQREGAIEVAPGGRVRRALHRMRHSGEDLSDTETAIQVAQRDGTIAAVVTAELHRTTTEYVLILRALSVPEHRVLGTVTARAPDEQALLRELARDTTALRSALMQYEPAPVQQLPAVTTRSLVGLQFFAKGVALADSVLQNEAGSWPPSLELFRKAVEEDPEFAMAHVWLAMATKFAEQTALSNVDGTRTATEVFRREAQESLRLAAAGFVSESERLFIEGAANALLERHAEAIAAFETLVSADSGFFELRTRTFLAHLYPLEGRWADRDRQVLELARLRPDDFDALVQAAEVLLVEDKGETDRAVILAQQARTRLLPAVRERENSCWLAAWLDHLPVYDAWVRGDLETALDKQRALAASLQSRASIDRDAMATTSGYSWLMLGRVRDARMAFEAVGHVGQRELNLALLADLLDDRPLMARHLGMMGWAYNPVPFARAGLFARARTIMEEPTVTSGRKTDDGIARGEFALAEARWRDAIALLQPALDQQRYRPSMDFYNTSLSLAAAWRAVGNESQALRVLEEAARERATHLSPGSAAAWWIKALVELSAAYRRVGRLEEAEALDQRVETLLTYADPDLPFLRGAPAPPRTPWQVRRGS